MKSSEGFLSVDIGDSNSSDSSAMPEPHDDRSCRVQLKETPLVQMLRRSLNTNGGFAIMGTTILSANEAADRLGSSHQPPAFEIKSVRNTSCSDLGWPQVVIRGPEMESV